LSDRVVTLKGDLQEAERQREQVYDKKREIDAINPERLGNLAAELAEAVNEVADEKGEISRLEKQAEMLETVDKELEQTESEKRAFEKVYKEYELAKSRLEKMPTEDEIETEKKPLTTTLQEVARKLALTIENIGYAPKTPKEELAQLRKKKEEYDQNVPIAKRKAEYESSVLSTSRELSDFQTAFSIVLHQIEELGYDEEEHGAKQEEFNLKGKEVKDFTADIAGTEQAKIGAEEDARKYRDEVKALEEKIVEKKMVDSYIVLLNKIRDAYGKDGIQKMIRARARPLLEKTTRDLFERFNLAYSDIKIDDDYNISVIGPSGEQDIDQISGGERVALAIALRLAIAQVLSGRIETVIMDEPTTHLDEERRKELVNILNSFFREGGRIIPQMLIITHHSEIEEVADVVYSVKKKEGYSTVESGKYLDAGLQ
jgi:exonuclease SbcC